ncbi:MAG: hypothetical protein E6G93_11205 [Alphaproteobacteria bacterium]|nr:MAG: hypothetical protein E6G93_11205 [Alphaproteobacteria bacterium]TMK49392.1 MAG: hypothetical protein E6G70_08980 [Alphaproteobacteria bacterium]
MIKSLIQLTARSSVQPQWDGWLRPRDEKHTAKANGGIRGQAVSMRSCRFERSMEVRLDTGEIVLGSRRFKAAVANSRSIEDRFGHRTR